MLREKLIQKTYWAIVKNKPAENRGTLTHYLKKIRKIIKQLFLLKKMKEVKKLFCITNLLKS